MNAVTDEGEELLLNIVGTKVALGPIRRDLVGLYARWFNDFQVIQTLGVHGPRPMTFDAEMDWYERASKDTVAVYFTIYELATRRPIGTTSLMQVDNFDGTATYGIVIGEKDCWGRGYGTETTQLMLSYAFDRLGLHNVQLFVFADNVAGLRAYLKAGFKEIGRRREAHRRGGRLIDVVYMDCLESEFVRPKIQNS
jgi:RimJ/RimL family protein N-acetyltransferase